MTAPIKKEAMLGKVFEENETMKSCIRNPATINLTVLKFFKIAFLTVSLTVTPFLRAENVPGASDVKPSNIYVYSDYEGTLYVDGEKFGGLYYRDKNPLEISNSKLGPHSLREQIRGGNIYCDVQTMMDHVVYVYMRHDVSRVGQSLEEINYKPYSRAWIYTLIGLGGFIIVAGIFVGVMALERSDPGIVVGGFGNAAQ